MGIERGDDEVDEVDGKRKIKDELGTCNKEQDEYGTGSVLAWMIRRDVRSGSVPGQAVQEPNETEGPADSRIAAQAAPTKQKVCTDVLAEDQGREDDENGGAGIVGELEQDDLRGDARGGEIRERAGARWAATAWHEPGQRTLSCGGHVWSGEWEMQCRCNGMDGLVPARNKRRSLGAVAPPSSGLSFLTATTDRLISRNATGSDYSPRLCKSRASALLAACHAHVCLAESPV